MQSQARLVAAPEAHKLEAMSSAPPETESAHELQPGGAGEPTSDVHAGKLHVYVAFDWGEEVLLDRARSLVPAETHVLPRRRRTPSSIAYRPPPLRVRLPAREIALPELGPVRASAEATVFDFAAVSLAMHVPFFLPHASLVRLANGLAEPTELVRVARSLLQPLHHQLLPAIQSPSWQDDLSEEYFVFQLPPDDASLSPALALQSHASWLAGLVRLESGPLSSEEVAEALRLYIRYSPDDLFVADWAAAVLIDQDCDETLQTIEFANLQLLEFRHIDNRLDDSLAVAYRVIHALNQSWLPFWRSHGRSLRVLGELKVEANGLFERTENVLKLVGDQYLARVYRLMAGRFHLQEWEQSILRKLEVGEGVYQVVSDQTDTYRAEFLELIVVVLIVLEVLLALFRH
jgi:hypothetical protein